jgi:transposase
MLCAGYTHIVVTMRVAMTRYVEGEDRSQVTLFPASFDEYIAADNPVRVDDVFVDELDLRKLGFDGMQPEVTGRPAYHPGTLLKIYIYGYLNRIQSSRRLERETQRNVELIWLTGRLMPDFKTIADFRKDNGKAISQVCKEFVVLCRSLNLFSDAIVAIDGSKFKAVNNRDKNFTDRKLKARMEQLEESITRYLAELDRADRQPAAVTEVRVAQLQDKVAAVRAQMRRLRQIGQQMAKAPGRQVSLTDPDARSMATSGRGTGIVGYNVQTAVDDKHHLIVAHEVTNVRRRDALRTPARRRVAVHHRLRGPDSGDARRRRDPPRGRRLGGYVERGARASRPARLATVAGGVHREGVSRARVGRRPGAVRRDGP